jgi:nucleoside-diphosphate-sugar epimerase
MNVAQQNVLVTGASGFIGRVICPSLESKRVTIRGFDRNPCDVVADFIRGELSDLSALRRAASGMDAIIHLAACSDDADFITHLVPSNVIGLYHVLEAARLENVRRFIFASTCQVADLAAKSRRITVNERHPTDHYSLTKLWGEEMAEMYSRQHGISVVAARLGWVVRNMCEFDEIRSLPHGPRLFLGPRDLCDFVYRAVIASLQGFAIMYAISRQPGGEIFEMETARRILGFEPRDVFPDATFGW